MKKVEKEDYMRSDYSDVLKNGVRGKHYQRYRQGTNIVKLDPEIVEKFSCNAEAINEALRLVIRFMEGAKHLKKAAMKTH